MSNVQTAWEQVRSLLLEVIGILSSLFPIGEANEVADLMERMDERKSNINALAGLDMSEEKDDRVDFEFVRDAIENQDQEMKIVAKDFIRWMKESDEHNGLYELMVATTGKSEEEIDAFILANSDNQKH